MRTLLVVGILALTAPLLRAQDPGQQAAQQATQQAIENSQIATQIAQQQMQQASDQATRDMMNNAATTSTIWGCCPLAAKPTFSLKPGYYSGTTAVKIRDTTRGATIYYTTDGWTPTTRSLVYTGPVTIDSTTTLQALAVAPNYSRSLIAVARYTLPAPATNTPASIEAVTQPSASGSQLVLVKGTAVPLVFAEDVNSKTADVGDKIQLKLDVDIQSGDNIIVKKGASATAIITQVDRTGAGGQPGDIAFKVDSLTVNGTTVDLRGFASKEGQAKLPNAAVLIPVVGPFTMLKHGTDAQIKKGTVFTAYVKADTPLTKAD